jgi:hypothetical protein
MLAVSFSCCFCKYRILFWGTQEENIMAIARNRRAEFVSSFRYCFIDALN